MNIKPLFTKQYFSFYFHLISSSDALMSLLLARHEIFSPLFLSLYFLCPQGYSSPYPSVPLFATFLESSGFYYLYHFIVPSTFY